MPEPAEGAHSASQVYELDFRQDWGQKQGNERRKVVSIKVRTARSRSDAAGRDKGETGWKGERPVG